MPSSKIRIWVSKNVWAQFKKSNINIFSAKIVSFMTTTRFHAKNWLFLKKYSSKKLAPKGFYDRFSKKNRKKIEIFLKFFFFKSCSFDAKTSAKKKNFFEKNPPQNFGQNFDFHFCDGIVFFQKFSNFFSFFLVIYAPKNGFRL